MTQVPRAIVIIEDDYNEFPLFKEIIHQLDKHIQVYVTPSAEQVKTLITRLQAAGSPVSVLIKHSVSGVSAVSILAALHGVRAPKFVWGDGLNRAYAKLVLESGARDYFVKPRAASQMKVIFKQVVDVLPPTASSTASAADN